MKRPQAEIDRAPLTDCSIDLLISNGFLNLCPDKPRVLGEVFRFFEPGGRFQMADILLEPTSRRRRWRARDPGPTEWPQPCGSGHSRSARPGGVRGGQGAPLDRVSHIDLYPGGAGVGGQVPGRLFQSAAERHQGLECPRRRANRVE
jgi:hypothetical protein